MRDKDQRGGFGCETEDGRCDRRREADESDPRRWIDKKKNLLKSKVCCNPAAILWQFPHPFVVDVFWDEFFR